ncbi:EamA family transporter [Nocardioides sp.]|uniref:EamA family transporter n=1 Tax=Nocardioides sp. TaxID=35761 RepID=UPI0035292C2A
MVVALALGAAVSYGLTDFVGGTMGRRFSPFSMALVMQLAGALLVASYAVLAGGDPRLADLGWALAAGTANGIGTMFLYRGLAFGRMSVVSPVSAVSAALLPVLAGLLLGERLGPWGWAGVLAALPGIWLVSRVSPATEDADGRPTGLRDGILAGLGFAGFFVALDRIPERAGLLPLAVNEVVAGAVIVGLAMLTGSRWRPSRGSWLWGSLTGALGALASALFLAATQTGLLAIAAVLTSLYPAVTVMLAAAVHHERVHGGQVPGLALCLTAVALVAAR